jgi:predicted ATPase
MRRIKVVGWAASVFLWTGDIQGAEEYIDAMIYHAQSNSLKPFVAVGQARKGELALLKGAAKSGVENLQAGLDVIHAIGYEVLTTEFNISLARGLTAVGQSGEAINLLDQTIGRVETNGDDLYLPELLRVKGNVLRSLPRPRVDDAENCFIRSLEMSHHQGARAWELRTATDLAALWATQGRTRAIAASIPPI